GPSESDVGRESEVGSPRSEVRRPKSAASPDSASFLPHHGGAGLALEGLLKFRGIGDHPVGPIFVGGVGVDGGPHAFGLVTGVGTPGLPVANEETLLGCEAVNRLQLLAPGFVLPGHVSQYPTAQFGDIFAHGQFAVTLDVI